MHMVFVYPSHRMLNLLASCLRGWHTASSVMQHTDEEQLTATTTGRNSKARTCQPKLTHFFPGRAPDASPALLDNKTPNKSSAYWEPAGPGTKYILKRVWTCSSSTCTVGSFLFCLSGWDFSGEILWNIYTSSMNNCFACATVLHWVA